MNRGYIIFIIYYNSTNKTQSKLTMKVHDKIQEFNNNYKKIFRYIFKDKNNFDM